MLPSTMAESSDVVHPTAEEAAAPQARRPFAAPSVQDLGRLQTLTQLQFSIPP